MRKILIFSITIAFLSGCSTRDFYLHLASESMTVTNQQYYIKEVQKIDQANNGRYAEQKDESCGASFYPVGYGGFTTSCS